MRPSEVPAALPRRPRRRGPGRIAPVAVALLVALAGCGQEALSAASTCTDFLAAEPADQQSVTQQLAGRFAKPDYATPLGMPAVPYFCAQNPETTLGEFFEAAG